MRYGQNPAHAHASSYERGTAAYWCKITPPDQLEIRFAGEGIEEFVPWRWISKTLEKRVKLLTCKKQQMHLLSSLINILKMKTRLMPQSE